MRTITLAIALAISCSSFARENKVSSHQAKPLSFIENKGQITDQHGKQRKDIDVKLETPGMNVFVGDGAIHYQWYKSNSDTNETAPFAFSERGIEKPKREKIEVETYRMDVELVGANMNAEVVYEEQQDYFENYYLTQCPDGAVAHTYNRITYKNVYPGIDWVLYSKGNQLKYDFVVQAGADTKQIQLKYSGATQLILKDGAVHAVTPFGSIAEAAPYSYSAETGKAIPSSFGLDGNTVKFNVASYTGTLIIDPTLEWATYYGGTDIDYASAVCSDKNGGIYITGTTNSSTNIATTGTFQTTISAPYADGFIAKFSSAGTRLWGSYVGNSGLNSEVNFQAICSDGVDMYVTGYCGGIGLATPGAFQTAPGGPMWYDAIMVKFSNSGQRIWATYFGKAEDEMGYACFADTTGVYFGGASDSLIVTPGTFQTLQCPAGGGFLAKFSFTGTRLWSTYYPGVISSITGYRDSVIYICGTVAQVCGTAAASPGAHQATGGGVSQLDGFVARFTTNGARVWGTFYGGTNPDYIGAVATDPAGFLYLTGHGWSTNNIATPGTFKPVFSSTTTEEGYLVKFDPSGVRLWGTYTHLNAPSRMVIDTSGRLYLTGRIETNVPGFASANAVQTTFGGGQWDAFLSIFTNAGWPVWNTYFGAGSHESASAICYAGHRVYIAGHTYSTSGMATANGHQTSYGGGTYDGFLAQFKPDTYIYMIDPTSVKLFCKGDSARIRYGTTGTFNATNVFTVQLSNAAGSFASPTVLGTKAGQTTDSVNVYVPTTLINGTGYKVRVLASSPADTSYDLGINVTVAPSPPKPIASVNNPVCAGDSLKLSVSSIPGVTWSWTGPNSFSSTIQNPGMANATLAESGDYIVAADLNGCVRKDTVSVSVGLTPAKPAATNNTPICAGASLSLTAVSTTPVVSYSWTGPMSFSSTAQNPSIPAATPGHAGDYVVTATLGSCHSKDTTTAIVNNVSSIGAYVSPNDTFCNGTLASFVAVPFNGGASPTFQWYKNGTLIPGATGLVYSTSGAVTGDSFYCRMIATGVCVDPLELYSPGIEVVVLPVTSTPSVTINSNPALPLPGVLTTFTATALNGGANPTYQWLRNGQHVIGATNAIWSASTLHPYDQISCVVFSSDVCADPKTDTSGIVVVNFPTSVNEVNGKNWQVYPNPATNELTIEGEAGMQVSILNVLGQEVYSCELRADKEVINISQFVAGSYVVLLVDTDGVRSVVKIQKQ